jgi:hypothetical protein
MIALNVESICCILGAGYSHAAGVPLTRELFTTRNVAISSDAANRRFQTVWRDYEAWLSENPSRNPEEYLADLLKHSQSVDWALNKGYVLGHNPLSTTSVTEAQCPTLSFPDLPVPTRAIPPFEWAVELIGAALATPLSSDTSTINYRYGARVTFPFHCTSHSAFWREITGNASHVAAVTTNFDILIERGLRHKRMRRVFGPGFYYGGIPKPQLLRGTFLPWADYGSHLELEGAIPIYKLHGSLNWSRAGEGLELFQDLRPAFRGGGDAAIIPPVPEKEIPTWLRLVWASAEEELGRATVWIICGYSLPAYDTAIVELLSRAAKAGNLRRILVLDPYAPDICCRYSAIVQNVQVVPLDGLPAGVNALEQLL